MIDFDRRNTTTDKKGNSEIDTNITDIAVVPHTKQAPYVTESAGTIRSPTQP